MSVFSPETRKTQTKYTQFHRFQVFQATFLVEDLLLSSVSMPNINKIDCGTEKNIEVHTFTPLISSKSSTAGNIAMFEDLNIKRMGIERTDAWWNDWLTIW